MQCRIPNDPWFQESGGLGKPGNTFYWNNDPDLPKPWSESLDPTFSMLMGAKWSRDLLEAGHCLPINPVLGARIKIVLGKYRNGDDKNKDLIESIIWSAKREIILPARLSILFQGFFPRQVSAALLATWVLLRLLNDLIVGLIIVYFSSYFT